MPSARLVPKLDRLTTSHPHLSGFKQGFCPGYRPGHAFESYGFPRYRTLYFKASTLAG